MFYASSDAPDSDVPNSKGGHEILSINSFVGGAIHDATQLTDPSYIAPIVVSHTEVDILKFQFFNSC